MKLTIPRVELLNKLKERQKLMTEQVEADTTQRDNFVTVTKIRARQIASAMLLANNDKILIFVDGGRSYQNKLTTPSPVKIEIKIPMEEFGDFVPVPESVEERELIGIENAIARLEMATDENLVITDRDDYFRYIK